MASKKREKEEEEGFSLWAELPAEVQSNVLGWLPLRLLFRCKLVCKQWDSAISSPSFTHFPSLRYRSGHRPWLIFFTPESFDFLLAFDFDGLSWLKFDVGFLSSMLDVFHVRALPSAQRGFVWCAGTASGRLLLNFRSSLHVCNPLTKSLFKLPSFKCIEVIVTQGFSASHMRCILAHVKARVSSPITGISTTTSIRKNEMQGFLMPTDSGKCASEGHFCAAELKGKARDASEETGPCLCAHYFSVMVIGKAKRELLIEAYCFSRNSWEIVGSMPTCFIMKHDQMIECDGVFYSLLLNPFGMLVVGESTENGMGIWRIQDLPVNGGEETRRLLACQNSIFLVCPVDELNKGLIVCRFESNSRCWIKMRNMPECILEDMKSIAHSNWVDCVGVGNFICFRALCTLRVLSYDICNELWSWLPEPSILYDTVFTRGHEFEPRLDFTQFV
ncbi:hypothetical protein GOP47_0019293 [Adiantum capillus-veneris]|uniref:F-box domain-containing protein n=1 Tax=Adiantum capillus-veneris TaxID=13818 RepID=A0A9D4Z9H8_ADICA|nr:hypothetical protein GOP47_0019293 [Adiantum capillus-veneris]